MKSLREYRIQQSGSESSGPMWSATFSPALHAEVNGLRVRVLNIGDLPGASTVYNCADATGFSTPVKQIDTRFIDPAALPLTDLPTV
jgi:hypothetical protein